jgi:hypothetical protein
MRPSLLPQAALALTLLVPGRTRAAADPPPKAETFLIEGRLAEGERELAAALEAAPDDDTTRFGLGVIQFVRAVEARVQGFYRHGLNGEVGGGFLRNALTNLPVPPNPAPRPLDAAGFRAMLQGWVDDLRKSEATLARVKDPAVKLPLHFGQARLDLNGDGRSGEGESLGAIFTRLNQRPGVTPEAVRDFVIAFDRGDVDWLRGYCHLLMAVAEVVLAHDTEEIFRETGYLFFRGARPPHPFLTEGVQDPRFQVRSIVDLVAMIHLVRLPVAEPDRLRAVLGHLEAMAALSRSSWKSILAETDDDHEWIPNPRQATVVPGGAVSDEMVQSWLGVLDEFEAVLAGKALIPFWRGVNPRLGVNLRRVLTEPRAFDLVMWVRGSAAAPYLEEGRLSSAETWGRLTRVFRGEFIGFAIWFN